MKRFYSSVLFFAFVLGATPAFASLSISVGSIEQFSDGADVPIAIYEDGTPVAVDFSFELDDGYNIVSEGSGSTDENGQAVIIFSGLSSGTDFKGEIWVGGYDDFEAFQTFSFSTETESIGCNAGGVGLIGLALIGLPVVLKKKK